MRQELAVGTVLTLATSLMRADLWQPSYDSFRKGKLVRSRVNPENEAARFGITEFNTWYVRGLAARLRDEGETECQVYRAGLPRYSPAACSVHEGRVYPVDLIYTGHRRRYWPDADSTAFSIPLEPNCHHSIRRLPRA